MFALIDATQENDIKTIKSILFNNNVDIDQYDHFGRTPLIYATIYQYVDIVELLLKHGADPQLYDQDNLKSCLHYASENGNIEITLLLLKYQAQVSTQDDLKRTPLHSAINMGNLEISKLLIKYGADVNNKSINGLTPLHYAAQLGFNDIIETLIKKGAIIDSKDKKLQTPFIYACIHGKTLSAYLLIKKGAYIGHRNLDEYDALQLAILNNKESTVEFLLNMGFPVNNIAVNNNSTLHCAVRSGNINIVQNVINNGCDINVVSFYGTALHEAIDNSHILKLLLESGANPNIKGKHGYTALHILIRWSNGKNQDISLKMLNDLLTYGSDINLQSDNGCTPLHLSLLFNKHFFTKEILKNKFINYDISNNNGETIKNLIDECFHL